MADDTVATYDRMAGWFAERHWQTRLEPQMERLLELVPPGGRVLDAGCGPGRDCAWLAELGREPIGLDLSAGMLAEAGRRVPGGRFLLGDLRALPMPAASVDGVWMCASLLHLPKREAGAALREARGVMPVGAPLYVGVQEGSGQGWRSDVHGPRWFSYWQAGELAAAIAGAGFGVRETTTFAGGPVRWVTIHAVAVGPLREGGGTG